MSSHNNPYAQAGWPNSQNPNYVNNPSYGQPSLLGALPTPFDVPKEIAIGAGPLQFRLTHPHSGFPSILNSKVWTQRDVAYIEVVTDRNTTYFRNLSNNKCIAFIEWGAHPLVSINGGANFYATQWLVSQPDGSRLVNAGGRTYKWMRKDNQFKLYNAQTSMKIAQVHWDHHFVTLLPLDSEAVRVGMMELIVSTVLLQSGRLA